MEKGLPADTVGEGSKRVSLDSDPANRETRFST